MSVIAGKELTAKKFKRQNPKFQFFSSKGLTAPAVSAVRKVVKKQLNQQLETKFVDVFSNLASNSTQTFYDLSVNITQGIADTGQRVGDTIKVKSFDYKLAVNTPSTGTQNLWRVTFFRWIPDTTSLNPTASMIYSLPANILSSLRHDARDQFKLIADHWITAPITSNDYKLLHKSMSGKYFKPVEYTAATAQGCNHIFMCIWANVTNVNDNLAWYTRTNYTDA